VSRSRPHPDLAVVALRTACDAASCAPPMAEVDLDAVIKVAVVWRNNAGCVRRREPRHGTDVSLCRGDETLRRSPPTVETRPLSEGWPALAPSPSASGRIATLVRSAQQQLQRKRRNGCSVSVQSASAPVLSFDAMLRLELSHRMGGRGLSSVLKTANRKVVGSNPPIRNPTITWMHGHART